MALNCLFLVGTGCGSGAGSHAGSGDAAGAGGSPTGDGAAFAEGAGDGEGPDGSATDGGAPPTQADGSAAMDATLSRPSYAPGTLAGTLVFSASFDGDAMAAPPPEQLYSIDLGTMPFTPVPLTVTPGRSTLMPTFSQDGQQLFFNQVDSNPSSPTYGVDVLVTARPDASHPRVLAPCGNPKDSPSPPFCQYASVGADGDVWYVIENKGSVMNAGYEIAHVALTAGATPTVWLEFPDLPVCAIDSMAMSPDGKTIAVILGAETSCGTGRGGLYVVSITSAGLAAASPITPYGSLDNYTEPFTAFNRAGDRVYYIGAGSTLYSEKLDGSDVTLVESSDLTRSSPGEQGAVIINDSFYAFGGGPFGIAAYPFTSLPGDGSETLITKTQPYGQGITWK